jgi:PhnB protein
VQVQTYLNFEGRCEEALEFYRGALGAEVTMVMRFKDSPVACDPGMVPPGAENKIMHMSFRIGDTTVLASDCRCHGKPAFQGFSLAITAPDADTAERLFAALSVGGQVQMPLAKTFFSPGFGVVADRFGVSWMIVVEAAAKEE